MLLIWSPTLAEAVGPTTVDKLPLANRTAFLFGDGGDCSHGFTSKRKEPALRASERRGMRYFRFSGRECVQRRNSSGNSAMFAAIRRASWRVRSSAADRRPTTKQAAVSSTDQACYSITAGRERRAVSITHQRGLGACPLCAYAKSGHRDNARTSSCARRSSPVVFS